MPDFFISYTEADEQWAEWISWTLEEAGFKVVLQKWDFAAGSNFVIEMQRAAATARRTIAVLSQAYLDSSRFGAAEWAAAFAKDPDGLSRTLIPVRIEKCTADGLLKSIVYVDLVGLEPMEAKERLLDYVKGERRKPKTPPSFPGAVSPRPAPPASSATREAGALERFMPRIKGTITDADRRRFTRSAFAQIQERFERSLAELKQQSTTIEIDFEKIDATKFTAEVFVSGKRRANCKIWIGGMMGRDDIAYAEGSTSFISNSLNDSLSPIEVDGELRLHTTMGAMVGRSQGGMDLNRLTIEEAGEYLWRRFSSSLEQ